jgi:guanylate kinase
MTSRDEGLLVVVSGPAGSGKSTLVDRVIRCNPDWVRRAVTATTRKPRPGEVNEKDYYFLERGEFEQLIADGEFLEHTQFNGNYYGTPRHSLEKELSKGGIVTLVIEVEGASAVREYFQDALFVFIIPPAPHILRKRLEARGTESAQEIENRLDIATREMQYIEEYDFLIVNGDLDTATRDLVAVIRSVDRSLIVGGELDRWQQGMYVDWHTRPMI